jgi:hypothetical protein
MLESFFISVYYTRNSGHKVDIASMCAESQDHRKLSSFHVPKHVLIAPDIEANFITLLAFRFCKGYFRNSTRFIQLVQQ